MERKFLNGTQGPRFANFWGLIRNLSTGKVSPQYHVVYDDLFSTVTNFEGDVPRLNWEKLIRVGRETYLPDEVDLQGNDKRPPLSTEWSYEDKPNDPVEQQDNRHQNETSVDHTGRP